MNMMKIQTGIIGKLRDKTIFLTFQGQKGTDYYINGQFCDLIIRK
jgi:hypothetical protein